MKKKIGLILALMLLIGITTVYGKPVSGLVFDKYPSIRVNINGESLDSSVPPFVIEGTSVAPVRSLAREMGGFVSYEDGTVNITKPHVNMIVSAIKNGEDNRLYPFMAVKAGQTLTFKVFVEVAQAPEAEELFFKVVIEDQDGTEQFSSSPSMFTDSRFIFTQKVPEFTFEESQDYYTVKFLMKTPDSDYVTVGQNVIYVE
ncbi:MAG: hypothetical protein H0Z33_04755 [Bacillaceae bacterium]|nr:hypothetical protein [Bacillaceae bacterium]